MRKIYLLIFVLLLVGCSSKENFVDNGNPGTIRVVVYNDLNGNEIKDEGEQIGGELVGISQDNSCPASDISKVATKESDENGEAIFDDLKPGEYCVMYMDTAPARTALTYEVALSSEEVRSIGFAIIRE